ncbi:MAG TPA: SPOR domain-containing protein [Burkholderiaceae bacterium]|nr:SPOR domain-containing protein [Burkholderiaceae bacterium]
MSFAFLHRQHGSTLLGFVVGLVVGLGIAVAVALYITNAPVPFVNKVRPASENINPGAGGPLPDPNKPLQSQQHTPDTATVPPPKLDAATDPKAAPPPPEKGMASAPDDGTRYLLQAGAFRTPDDADAMRARLALLGYDAKVFPRDQDGQTLYRVRLGPYGNIEDVNRMRKTMADNGIDAQLIKVR